ncbi:MAG: hypothetical protein BMS9Abin31_0120 [Gammaproteobacteria bacterium]|nr:MAG: hypothetical protein BMS9Abin31_0120 [Gammaproteobacteria bacterium]
MKSYSVRVLSGVLVSLLCVFVFNLLVNPYDIFEAPEITGFNSYKSEVERHTRLSKVYQVERIRPDAILLASSRGLVVPDSYLSESGATGFNLSLTSASTYELFRMFQHAQASHPLKSVMLALDEEFTDIKQPNFTEQRLAVNPDGSINRLKWLTHWRDMFTSLFSMDALRASFRTIRKQKDNPETMDYQQYMSKRIFNAGGHRQMFRNMEASIFSSFRGVENLCEMPSENTHEVHGVPSSYFEAIVDMAYKNNIDLYVYFSPAHARLYEAKCMIGKWAQMENMKRAVVKYVKKKADIYSVKPFPVWDFSGYNSITTESVPALGDKISIMAWYNEGSHYTRKTAKLVFDKIFSHVRADDDFGRLITVDNVEGHLIDIREQRKQYVLTHTSDIEELNMLFTDSVSLNKQSFLE